MSADTHEYYESHQKLPFIGTQGQQQLQQAKVVVIGAGGLGLPMPTIPCRLWHWQY